MTALETYSALKANGVEIYLGTDGSLRARGGNFTPELRTATGFNKLKLEEMLRTTGKGAILFEAEADWLRELGGVKLKANVVSAEAEKVLSKTELDYLNDRATIHDVEAAFANFVRSTGTRRLNRQLTGDILLSTYEGKREPQSDVHAEFKKMVAGEPAGIARKLRSSVTPQIEPTESQLDQMQVYFGISRESYITGSMRARSH